MQERETNRKIKATNFLREIFKDFLDFCFVVGVSIAKTSKDSSLNYHVS